LIPDLAWYDWILINTSAGKDSQTMLDYVVSLARRAGVLDRVVAVHADLGRVEWQGVRALAERQATHYGVRFIAVSRPQGDLLDHVEQHGKWPGYGTRWCTSDHKRGQVYRVLTQLADEAREGGRLDVTGYRKNGNPIYRPARILNCMGLRAQESPKRAKQDPFAYDEEASTATTRHVDEWLPIHDWTTEEVWTAIRASGVPHHPAYDMGMPRLSCCFCIYASKSALVRAAQLNPSLAKEYARVEVSIGHRFKKELSMAEIIDAAVAESVDEIEDWAA
jgi:3'-phosphoadenosine 5'-phosphosulfate sulfotransferase (PAPS reductase)/FAD synthetase